MRRLPYRYLEDVAIADAAFEVSGHTLKEVFTDSAKAVSNIMVDDLESVARVTEREVKIRSDSLEYLLFDFLQKLVYYKDAERLLFSGFEINIFPGPNDYVLEARIFGEEIDSEKHRLSGDVKAVTMHKFKLEKRGDTWIGMVVLDT